MKKTLILIALALLTISVAAQDESAGNALRTFRLSAAERKRTLQDMSEDEAEAFLKERHERRLAVLKEVISGRGKARTDSTQYDCGEIQIQQGMTPFGGRTYTVPIVCEADSRRVPSLALSYNSQAGYGAAGYGWDISGVSRITITNRTWYYDGNASGADVNDTSSVFALDGVRLVRNSNAAYPDYQYETANGHVLVKKHAGQNGLPQYFTAMYPDGSLAQFGSGNSPYPKTEFPLYWSVDRDGNRIDYRYDYDSVNDCSYLRYVFYGYDSMDDPMGEVVFNYSSDRTDTLSFYQAGVRRKKSKLLTSVNCLSGNTVLRTYTLGHVFEDNASLLTQIRCTDGTSELPPLVFHYGYEYSYVSDPVLSKTDSINVGARFLDEDNLTYLRGKFVSGVFDDGILVVPNLRTYWSTGQIYYSPYLPSQKFIMVASTFFGSTAVDTTTFVAGSGFQTIQAVDADADGVDEIVKVNFGTANSSGTPYTITKYKFNRSTFQYGTSSVSVTLSGRIKQNNQYSPYQRGYYWGDFVGKGKVQLLAIAYSTNAFNVSQTCYASLIDIDTGTKLSEEVLFNLPIADAGNILTFDIDGDGKTELCRATSSGLQVYKLSSNNQFELVHTVPELDTSVLAYPFYIVDVNGDGYPEIVKPALSKVPIWTFYANDGAYGFHGYERWLCSLTDTRIASFVDVNKDGLPDLVVASSGEAGTLYMNVAGDYPFGSGTAINDLRNIQGIIPGNVVDTGGESAFMRLHGYKLDVYSYNCPSPEMRQLICSVDSFGNSTYNAYDDISEGNSYTAGSSYSPSEGYMVKTLPLRVLTDETTYLSHPSGSVSADSYYTYDCCTINNLGLGLCGFRSIRSYDRRLVGSPVIKETLFGTEQRGLPLGETVYVGSLNSNPVQTVSNTYDANTTTYGKLNPRLIQSISYNNLTGVRDTTKYSAYDAYDFPETVYNSKSTASSSPQTTNTTFTYSHSATASLYLLGSVTEEMTSFQNDGNDDDIWSEKTVVTFDTKKHPVNVKRYVGLAVRDDGTLPPLHGTGGNGSGNDADNNGENPRAEQPWNPDFPPGPIDPPLPGILIPIADKLVSDTEYTYDSWGHVTSEAIAMYGAEEYVGNNYEYDEDGRFLYIKTDALGREITYSGYNHYGQPASATDWLSRTTSHTYDTWGTLTGEILPDGSSTAISRSWVTTGPGLYSVSTSGNDGSQDIVFYDSAGRVIRRSSKRFDGAWTIVDTEYDARGRVSRVSLPFTGASAASGTASLWTTYTYDIYGRPTAVNEPSGRSTSWSYSGLSTAETKESRTTTRTTDVSGRLVSAADPGGTITYSLRDDGQPLSVTAPGNVTTTFTYDGWGRRTGIADPSAGARTWAYVQNANGSSSLTETNPNGTVTTYSDKYGRQTQVVRSGGFSTLYAYGTYGDLLSERSTNGTSRTYTYDAYDRPLEVTDSIPDGKWLRMHFAYDSNGVLHSTAFTSQDGAVTTEYYGYVHGHKVRTVLADSTVVWQLDSANVFGQPTQATTAGLTRTYSFNQYGIPTGRGFGAYQQYTYAFNNSTGNLILRYDKEDHLEVFSYDSCGRLIKYTGSSYDSYDTYGNILSLGGATTMQYGDTSHPYRITSATFSSSYTDLTQTVSYTPFNRPSQITRGNYSADFVYDGNSDRVRMQVSDDSGPSPVSVLTRYYLGDRLEIDVTPVKTTERFYLDGSPYSAPMVMVRDGTSGTWTLYNIGRDYLGSITDVACVSDSTFHLHYSYTPWGLQQDLEDAVIYDPNEDFMLFLGRGFTGHEHLPWFGLINMNARLYDPVLGRFLSPDPYVQSPDDTRNYNRYSYALNNPLKYTDESGEFVHIIIGAVLGGAINLAYNWKNCDGFWEYVAAFGVGAGAGALTAATGGAAAGVLASVWAGAMSSLVGGAATSAVNNMIAQTGKNFSGAIDWGQVGQNALIGGVGGLAGYGGGAIASKWINTLSFNGFTIRSPMLSKGLAGLFGGSVSGFAAGTAAGLVAYEGDWKNALKVGWQSALIGGAIGGSLGLGEGFLYAKKHNLDVWTGEKLEDFSFDNRGGDFYKNAHTLEEQLSVEEAFYNKGTMIIEKSGIKDPYWQGWDKMQHVHHSLDGGHYTVHYYQQTRDEHIYKSEFKFTR